MLLHDIPPSNSSTLASIAYWQQIKGNIRNIMINYMRGENTGWINQNSLIDFAKGAGVAKIIEFSESALGQKYSGLIKKNYDLAQSLALTATPSFILLAEGKTPLVIVGSQPFYICDYVITNKMS
jgi:protein-disulfide isomerase